MIKKLKKLLKQTARPSFKVLDKDACWECVVRHDEIDRGREVTFDDMRQSCYRHMFYSDTALIYLFPRLLMQLVNEQNDIDFEEEDILALLSSADKLYFYRRYSKKEIATLQMVLEFLHERYHKEEYEIWDDITQKVVVYDKERNIAQALEESISYLKKN